ncbi:MAG: hypothetical protein VX420_08375 [SAR324 cluster bacterium]|jgi:hypothetical protein|nr:hypothetical protein [SAR324 cluster bacterium]MEC7418209.1 hypothetical protein [SAR324 cluster bacterium]
MEASESAQILEGMVVRQREKLLKVARELVPNATPEDIRNPQDFSELLNDPLFNYEDGLLAGLLSAQAALRISSPVS